MPLILLVEDNLDMQSVLRELLEWDGYEVVCGASGRDALAVLESSPRLPDAIISDLRMPVMDGLTLLHAVRADPRWASMRFFMMSANSDDDRLKGEEMSLMDGILSKPFELDEFRNILNS